MATTSIQSSQHVQIVIASGTNEPKRVMLGLSMAASAAAAGTTVNVFLAMDGVEWLNPDVCDRVVLEGYPPAAELLSVIHESGGVVEYCPHCLPAGCRVHGQVSAHPLSSCGCVGLPSGLASYGVRLADWPTVVF